VAVDDIVAVTVRVTGARILDPRQLRPAWPAGQTTAYTRGDSLSFNFCPRCGCVTHWRSLKPDPQGRRRIAVNLRMTEPGPIARLPIDHFDGLEKWEDLPRDGRCIEDLWF
jgi:hypothetical protein